MTRLFCKAKLHVAKLSFFFYQYYLNHNFFLISASENDTIVPDNTSLEKLIGVSSFFYILKGGSACARVLFSPQASALTYTIQSVGQPLILSCPSWKVSRHAKIEPFSCLRIGDIEICTTSNNFFIQKISDQNLHVYYMVF